MKFSKFDHFFLAVLILILAPVSGKADPISDWKRPYYNSVVLTEADADRNRKFSRLVKKRLERRGQIVLWVVLNPDSIDFQVLPIDLSDDEKSEQMNRAISALDDLIAPLAADGSAVRAPTPIRNGISELVRFHDVEAVRSIASDSRVLQLKLP